MISDEAQFCEVCGAANHPESVVCVQCGSSLPGAPADTTIPEAYLLFELVRPREVAIRPGEIAFYIAGQPQPVILQDKTAIVLGRSAAGADEALLDLSPPGGLMLGVSRRHALITVTDDAHIIKDLGSTNGTWVNDLRLPPHKSYILRNGDLVKIGQLRLYIYFEAISSTRPRPPKPEADQDATS